MPTPSDYHSPFDDLVGLRITSATGAQVLAELEVTPRLHQPNGILHGGVHATIIEVTASVGGSLWLGEGRAAVGVSNHTDFLRSVSEGMLHAEALPIQQGRTLQLWRVDIVDDDHRPIASGRVRLMNLPPDDA